MIFFTILGFIVWYLTYLDIRDDEASSVFLINWIDIFDFNRMDFPIIFWLFVSLQILIGLLLVLIGFEIIDVENIFTKILTALPT